MQNYPGHRPSSPSLPKPGDVIGGKYRIDGVIGTGGMGVVLRALDTSLNRPVAIKFLAPEKTQRDGATARFLREARAAAAIQSEHVVRVFEVSTADSGVAFIVMEQLQGVDLAQLLERRGALPIEEACDYLLQACEALAEAHARGIVHRDLKPQNLFLAQRADGSPLIKVLDFGISKHADEGSQALTATDTVMGTPLYMSPEQVRSLKNVDARADVWALGVILFELITMAAVFDAPTASALAAAIAMDPPTPLRARRPQAPQGLEEVILRCLRKDPNGRYPDVAAFAEAIAPHASPRGHESARRIGLITRGSGPSLGAAGAAPAGPPPGFATTASAGFVGAAHPPAPLPLAPTTLGAPGPVPVPVISHPPPGGPAAPRGGVMMPTTVDGWQHPTGASRPQQGAGSKVGLIAFGAAGMLLVVGAAATLGYTFATRQQPRAAATAATPSASAPPPPPTASSPPPPTAPPPVPPSPAPTASNKAAPPKPAPKPDNSAAAEEEARIRRTEAMLQRCDHFRGTIAVNVPADRRKSNATVSKLQTCYPNATQCEREVCRESCTILEDRSCLANLELNARRPPKPY